MSVRSTTCETVDILYVSPVLTIRMLLHSQICSNVQRSRSLLLADQRLSLHSVKAVIKLESMGLGFEILKISEIFFSEEQMALLQF